MAREFRLYPWGGPKSYFEQSVQAALQWRFSPFIRNGHAVAATFTAAIQIVPPERRRHDAPPMPEVRDWNSLRITLSRGAASARVLSTSWQFKATARLNTPEKCTQSIAANGVAPSRCRVSANLSNNFAPADYFALYPEYVWGVTDFPTFTTSISYDRVHQKVVDYGGEQVGMPKRSPTGRHD